MSDMPPPLLEAVNISRSFPGVHALTAVSVDLRPGEIHALIGENGAGKSTLIKILSGLIQPDEGQVRVRGTPVKLATPTDALERGISAVHQEFNYCPYLDAVENLYLGRQLPTKRWGMIDWPQARQHARAIFDNLGVELDLTVPLKQLNATHRKLVEIARGLVFKADVLILDEPTAALPQDEVVHFFEVIRRLRSMGVAVIYISHRLEEVFELADRVTVLRDGHLIATRPVKELSKDAMITMMVGRPLGNMYPKTEATVGEPVLEVRNLTRLPAYENITFSLRKGEILGLAGLVGAGRSEIAQAIAGVRPAERGTLHIGGSLRRIRSVQDGIRAGVAYVPEERQRQGLVLGMSIVNNVTLPTLRSLSRGLFLLQHDQVGPVREYQERLRIACASVQQAVGRLSGGNQQKCVLAKWLMTRPAILILDEPTRGIDVGAKAEVHALISSLTVQGISIVLITSELPELLAMSDRILVLHEGQVTAEFRRDEATQEAILRAATGERAPSSDPGKTQGVEE